MTKNKITIAAYMAATILTANTMPLLRAEQMPHTTQQKKTETSLREDRDVQVKNVLKRISKWDKLRCLSVGNEAATLDEDAISFGRGWQGKGSYFLLLQDGNKYLVPWKLKNEQQLANWVDVLTGTEVWVDGMGKQMPADKAIRNVVHVVNTKRHANDKKDVNLQRPVPPQMIVCSATQDRAKVQPAEAQTTTTAAQRIDWLVKNMTKESLSLYLGMYPPTVQNLKVMPEKGDWKGPGSYMFDHIDNTAYLTPNLTDSQQFWNWCYVLQGKARTITLKPSEEFEKVVNSRRPGVVSPPANELTPAQIKLYLNLEPNAQLPGPVTHESQDGWQGPGVYKLTMMDGRTYSTPVIVNTQEQLANWALILDAQPIPIEVKRPSKELVDALSGKKQ